jgi:hypothetical protein
LQRRGAPAMSFARSRARCVIPRSSKKNFAAPWFATNRR